MGTTKAKHDMAGILLSDVMVPILSHHHTRNHLPCVTSEGTARIAA